MCNPRYTGRQVWSKQRKDEILLHVNDVAAGYETRMRWNEAGSWVWSDAIVQEPLISAGDFEAAQAIMAGAGRARRTSREAHRRVMRPYVLTEDDIRALITGLGDLRDIIRDAEPSVKAAVNEQLGLQVTCLPGQGKLRADVTISTEIFAGQTEKYGVMGRVRGANTPKGQYVTPLLTSEFALDAVAGGR